MVFLSPLAQGLEEWWAHETSNRGTRALAGLVEALDELVHFYETKLDKEQKRQVTLTCRLMRRRVSHAKAGLKDLGRDGRKHSSSDSSRSDSSDSDDDYEHQKRRKKEKGRGDRKSQRDVLRSALKDALGESHGGAMRRPEWYASSARVGRDGAPSARVERFVSCNSEAARSAGTSPAR